MSAPAIQTFGLTKKYRIGGTENYQTFRDAFTQRIRSPFRSIDRPEITALDEVTLEIETGKATGIIGANGAGKSTLLKLLSRITRPSSGEAIVRGRIGSLLEVGTGFHPELTGRENTYLSGAILGMTKRDITRSMDAIVEFAGIAKFLDTPVKHYSSGMYVRLGFSVAAHLEPDILLIDEVLSVGDMAFQKKCLGKMDDVAGSGRTVLFVSHNLPAVTRLCSDAIWLDNGTLESMGAAEDVAKQYSSLANMGQRTVALPPDSSKPMRLRRVSVSSALEEDAVVLESGHPIELAVEYDINEPVSGAHAIIFVSTTEGVTVLGTGDADVSPDRLELREPGRYRGLVVIPPYLLGEGAYTLTVALGVPFGTVFDRHADVVTFEVADHTSQRRQWQHKRRPGLLGLEFPWEVNRQELKPGSSTS